jgi:hypothetical protein
MDDEKNRAMMLKMPEVRRTMDFRGRRDALRDLCSTIIDDIESLNEQKLKYMPTNAEIKTKAKKKANCVAQLAHFSQ